MTDVGAAQLDSIAENIDFENFTIEQALNYQKTSGIGL
jgi:hypothetical protein